MKDGARQTWAVIRSQQLCPLIATEVQLMVEENWIKILTRYACDERQDLQRPLDIKSDLSKRESAVSQKCRNCPYRCRIYRERRHAKSVRTDGAWSRKTRGQIEPLTCR